MSIYIGPPVEGKHFIGRKKEIHKIQQILKAGMHILLSAPRRVGKTSIAKRTLFLLRKEGWSGIYVTVEGATDEIVLVQRIINELKKQDSFWKKAKSTFSDIFKEAKIDIEVFGSKLKFKKNSNDVTHLIETLGRAINAITGKFLIIIDELPVFLASLEKKENGIERVESLLNTFRSFRQYDAGYVYEKKDHVSWFFCGSISLENYASQRNLSYTINDVKAFKIGAYTPVEADEYLSTVSKRSGVSLSTENKTYIINKVGWPIPFYLGIVFEAASEEALGDPLTIQHIEDGYKISLETYKKDFDLWLQRLQLHIKKYDLHIELLKLIAKHNTINLDFIKAWLMDKEWKSMKELQLLAILDLLEADGYIVSEKNNFKYRSPLIKDYIINKFHL